MEMNRIFAEVSVKIAPVCDKVTPSQAGAFFYFFFSIPPFVKRPFCHLLRAVLRTASGMAPGPARIFLNRKEIFVYESGECLRKRCLFPKAMSVSKTSAPFSKQKKAPLHERNKSSTKKRLFTKAAPVYESSVCFRKRCIFTNPISVSKSNVSFQNKRPVFQTKKGASSRKK